MHPTVVEYKDVGIAAFLDNDRSHAASLEQTPSNLYQITSCENSAHEAPASDTLNFSLKPPTAA